jgi:hypothetical protein
VVAGGAIRNLFGKAVENVSGFFSNVRNVGVGVTVPALEVEGAAPAVLHDALDGGVSATPVEQVPVAGQALESDAPVQTAPPPAAAPTPRSFEPVPVFETRASPHDVPSPVQSTPAPDAGQAPASVEKPAGLLGPDGTPMQDYLKTRMPTPAEQLADDLQAFRGNDAERMREVAEGVNRLLEKGRRDDVEQALSATDNLVTFDPNTGVRILDDDRSSVSLDMLYRSLGGAGKNLSEEARRNICAEIARRHKQHLSGLAPGASEAQRADSQDYLMDSFTSKERVKWSRDDLNRVQLVSDRDRPYVELAVDGQIPGRQANVYGVENSLGEGELTSPLVMFRTDGSAPEVTRNHEGAHVETCMLWGKPASEMSIEELTTDELIARLAEGERDVTKMLRTVNEYRLDFMEQRAAIVRKLSSRTNPSQATENAIELYRRDIAQYADPANTQRLADGSIDALLKINEQLAYGVSPEEIIRNLRKAHTMQNYAQDA